MRKAGHPEKRECRDAAAAETRRPTNYYPYIFGWLVIIYLEDGNKLLRDAKTYQEAVEKRNEEYLSPKVRGAIILLKSY